MLNRFTGFLCLSALTCLNNATANTTSHSHNTIQPDSHAPIGVMGDHMHQKGEFMVSYRFMQMEMSGNLRGSDSISASDIATGLANPYANPPMSPPTVRVVPQDMETYMHMFGFMYAPTDDITLMAMLNYIDHDMELLTFQGAVGTTELGRFTTQNSGLSDSSLGLLYRLFDSGTHHMHVNLKWTLPTGSTDETAEVLTPMNTRLSVRLPYRMQTSMGSQRLGLGLTYTGGVKQWSWGAQVSFDTATENSSEGYRWGDRVNLTAWSAYRIHERVSVSARLNYTDSDDIDGDDTLIRAPVTTANPENYGSQIVDLAVGVNTVLGGEHRVSFEYSVPLSQDVNGVQMEMDRMLTLGYQIAF